MIKDPPLLKIRKDFARPSSTELAAFANLQTGYAVDAMSGRGALDYRIKPLAPLTAPMVGVAITCHCGPADNLGLFAALASAKSGDILVAATDGFTATSVTGDLLMGMARDLAGILGVGLPVFCAGLTPNSPVRNGPGTVGFPVVIAGVKIESGDILLGDNDGVVVIPRNEAAEVIKLLPDIRAAEASLEAKVKAGLGVPDFIQSILDSDRVVGS